MKSGMAYTAVRRETGSTVFFATVAAKDLLPSAAINVVIADMRVGDHVDVRVIDATDDKTFIAINNAIQRIAGFVLSMTVSSK